MAETKGSGVKSISTLPRTYTDDYAGWIEDTACAIEDGRFSEIDCTALADEVKDLGKTERRELESAFEVLIVRMLKTRYQPCLRSRLQPEARKPEKQTRRGELTMRVQRKHIGKFLRRSPSLRSELPELITDAYDTARLNAADETELDINIFPESCDWTVADGSWWQTFKLA